MDRSAPTNGAAPPLIERVRQVLAEADAAGVEPPGRPAIARQLGAKEHEVRRLLDIIRVEQTIETADHDLADAGASEPARGGWLVAWAGFVFGSLVSVAANVLASHIPPRGVPRDWHPTVWAEFAAAVWPIALLISVEVLSRVKWRAGAGRKIARFGVLGAVALFAAVISYGHITAVLTSWNYSVLAAHVGPLVIDGLMTISGFALMETGGRPRGARLAPTGGPTT